MDLIARVKKIKEIQIQTIASLEIQSDFEE